MNAPRMRGEELGDGVGGLGPVKASERDAANGLTLLDERAARDRLDLGKRSGRIRRERAPSPGNRLRFLGCRRRRRLRRSWCWRDVGVFDTAHMLTRP